MERFNEAIGIVRLIRAGAQFDAYEAFDRRLERTIFLKVARASDDATSIRVAEAHAAHWRRLAHANIPSMPLIVDIGRESGRWYLATQWLDGMTVDRIVDGLAPDTAEGGRLLLRFLERSLAALEPLHARGFVHGDIKPGNILADRRIGTVHLVDSIPQPQDWDDAAGRPPLTMVTQGFAAPEVLNGEPHTTASDLFSLGLVASDLARLFGAAPPAIVYRMTAARPWNRPASVAEALALLPASISETDVSPASASAPRDHSPISARPATDSPTLARSLAAPPASWSEASLATSVPVPGAAGPAATVPADFSIVAPPLVQPGRHFVVEVWIAPAGERAAMLAQATRRGRMVERAARSHVDLARDTLITVALKLPEFEVPEPVETLGWNGDIRNAGFMVKAPAALAPGRYPGSARLMKGQVPFASIWFDIEVGALEGAEAPAAPCPARVQRIARAFASYASQDRAEVLRRVQGIQSAGIDVFLDIVGLRTGDDWERVLFREIEGADAFYLFWSRFASQSKWVEREWRYALERRGLEFINPLALEDPRRVEPPAELRSKHFNDMLLAFIAAEDGYRQPQPAARAGS